MIPMIQLEETILKWSNQSDKNKSDKNLLINRKEVNGFLSHSNVPEVVWLFNRKTKISMQLYLGNSDRVYGTIYFVSIQAGSMELFILYQQKMVLSILRHFYFIFNNFCYTS